MVVQGHATKGHQKLLYQSIIEIDCSFEKLKHSNASQGHILEYLSNLSC